MEYRLGQVARRIRLAHDLELLDIASGAGVSQATLSRFERGIGWRRETDAIVAAYAMACNLTPEYIWRLALDEGEEDA